MAQQQQSGQRNFFFVVAFILLALLFLGNNEVEVGEKVPGNDFLNKTAIEFYIPLPGGNPEVGEGK